ncbi:MAG TPA: hypothetical protein VMV22_13555 [Acidimicrobiales bacterium]|nr:hypothetical protein [Acidimicrobiales bacterium]
MDATVPAGERRIGEKPTPWYRVRPGTAVAVAVGLFLAVSVLQWFNDGSGQAIAVLYVLPIALLAVTLGARGGLTGATIGFALFAVFEIVHSSGDIDASGWVVRAVGMFVLGWLLGRATDQTTASERATLEEQRRRCRLEDANRRYAEALEINDSIIQQIVAAKWMIERGRSDLASETLTETIAQGQRMVAGLLPTRVSPPRSEDVRSAPIGAASPHRPDRRSVDAAR